jgi:hypothetical protein
MEILNQLEKERFESQIEDINRDLTNSLELLKDILIASNSLDQGNYKHYFVAIIGRFRLNIESILGLLPIFKNDHRHKFSIGLIARCICSDVLTVMYLMTFIDRDDPEQKTLRNELEIIGTETYKSLKEIAEVELKKAALTGNAEDLQVLIESSEKLDKEHAHLLNDNGKIKKRKEFRATSNPLIINGLDGDASGLLTEKQKLLRAIDQGAYFPEDTFVIFKYYSNYHHYTIKSNELIFQKPFFDTHFLVKTHKLLLLATGEIIGRLGFPIDLKSRLDQILNNIDINNFPVS